MNEKLKYLELEKHYNIIFFIGNIIQTFGIGIMLLITPALFITGELGLFDSGWCFLTGLLLLIISIRIKRIFYDKEYYICPYCNKSVLVYYDWRCDYCHNLQGKEKFLFERCGHCKRILKTTFCEHCDKEVLL